MYWRKADAIHMWFERHIISNGHIENCESYLIHKYTLEHLDNDIRRIQYDHNEAPNILPIIPGSFSLGLSYDNWYFSELEFTLEQLHNVLQQDDFKEYHYIYSASW